MNRSFEKSQAKKFRENRNADMALPYALDLYQRHRWNRNTRVLHHIHGRGKDRRYNWFCNLIIVSNDFHTWGHDVSPVAMELVCLKAKMAEEKFRRQLQIPIDPDETRVLWNPEVMAWNIGRASLSGRVEELMSKESVKGTKFLIYGEELLAFLST